MLGTTSAEMLGKSDGSEMLSSCMKRLVCNPTQHEVNGHYFGLNPINIVNSNLRRTLIMALFRRHSAPDGHRRVYLVAPGGL
jgi:hypothetical protein